MNNVNKNRYALDPNHWLFFFFTALCPQVLQNDLEVEQVKVNSLTHMVVVVDENSGESATAALEDQLQVVDNMQDKMQPLFLLC